MKTALFEQQYRKIGTGQIKHYLEGREGGREGLCEEPRRYLVVGHWVGQLEVDSLKGNYPVWSVSQMKYMHKTVRDCGLYVQAAADPVNLVFQEAF